jgi:hypothetical protein
VAGMVPPLVALWATGMQNAKTALTMLGE